MEFLTAFTICFFNFSAGSGLQTRDRVSGFLILMATSSSATAFLVFSQIFCAVSAQQCGNEYSIYGMMLERHTFKKTKASNWSACVQACNDDTRCQSMNFVIGQEICELNNRTKEARPKDIVLRHQRSYMKRSIKRGIILRLLLNRFLGLERTKILKDPSQARLCYCFDLKFAIKLLVERA